MAWLSEHADLLAVSVCGEGRIREGHGDLHAGNICLTDDDGIVIYDCIEFCRRFRCRDVACELAFLAMDLDLRGFRGFAGFFLRRYATMTDDADLPLVAGFYKLHLALVRAFVASVRAADPLLDEDDRIPARAEARRYVHLAGAYALPPALILMSGLPATGKSHAARALAHPFEAVVLRSDVVRKELAGSTPAPVGGPSETGRYAPEVTRRTYAALLERARDHLGRGRTVIVDATFSTAAKRRLFLDAAGALEVPCVLVEMTCSETVVRERLRARAGDADEPSDADWSVYRYAKERFEPPREIPERLRIRLDSSRTGEQTVAAVIDRLVDRVSAAPHGTRE